jgi:peptide/nickel transport system ATP-binding protein
MQLTRPTSGSVRFESVELTTLAGRELRRARQRMQMVFQDPMSSLNPRRRVRAAVAEGLAIDGNLPKSERDQRVDDSLTAVGLDPIAVGTRRPRQFSGGQAQRICIARALTMSPSMLICDEPVSALDVSVQAQILNLLEDMKAEFGLTMLFIAHDLAVVKSISDVVLVMYKGKLCEIAPPAALFAVPAHPYTRLLLDSVPRPVPERLTSAAPEREPISSSPMTIGCRFRDRCPSASVKCAEEEPEVRLIRAPDHYVACHHPNETS